MEAASPLAAPTPIGLPAAGLATAEAHGQEDFSAALMRSLSAGEAVAGEVLPQGVGSVAALSPAPVVAAPPPAAAAAPLMPIVTSHTLDAAAFAKPLADEAREAEALPSEETQSEAVPAEDQPFHSTPPMVPSLPCALPASSNAPPPVHASTPTRPEEPGEDADSASPGAIAHAFALPPATPPPRPALDAPSLPGSSPPVTLPRDGDGEAKAEAPRALEAGGSEPAEARVPAAGPPPAERASLASAPSSQANVTPLGPASLPPDPAFTPSPRPPGADAPFAQVLLSPARQVSSVAVALAFAPAGSSGFQLSLEPAELGRVAIHVRRAGETHSVHVTAERPETLALLQRDRHELDRGLSEAGLRLEPSGIEFALDTRAGGDREGGTGRRPTPPGQASTEARATPAAPEGPPPRGARNLLDINI